MGSCVYVGGGVGQRALMLHSPPAITELILLDKGGVQRLPESS